MYYDKNFTAASLFGAMSMNIYQIGRGRAVCLAQSQTARKTALRDVRRAIGKAGCRDRSEEDTHNVVVTM